MSLDIYFHGQPETKTCECPDCGNEHEANVLPDLFSTNITHNLTEMADAAGIYKALWRPEEIGITHAKQLIEPLTEGLAKLRSDPEKYRAYNAENGWGTYGQFLPFVIGVLEAAKQYPEAEISVSR